MQPTSGLFIHLYQRLGRLGLLVLATLAILATVTAVAFFAATEFLATTPDPIKVAPFRWHALH